MQDITWCPICQNAVIVADIKRKFAMCDTCIQAFCIDCKKAWHDTQPCAKDSKEKIEEITGKVEKNSVLTISEAELYYEFKSMELIKTNMQRCPKCGQVIQKISGCNKMVCARCSCVFCYLCGKQINGYDHFSYRGCVLFEDVVARIQENPNTAYTPITREEINEKNLGIDRCKSAICTKCGQINFKDNTGSNMIVCWVCRAQFCFICKELCYGTYHFTEYLCPRYSTYEQDKYRASQQG